MGPTAGRLAAQNFRHIQRLLTLRRHVGLDLGSVRVTVGSRPGRWAGSSQCDSAPPLCPIPRKTLGASAICRYDLAEVQAVFAGPYMEYQDGVRRWGRYEGGVPEPRPGSVSAQAWGQY